jgi:hypothetical protein
LVGSSEKFSTVFFLISFFQMQGVWGIFLFIFESPLIPQWGKRKWCLSALFRYTWPRIHYPLISSEPLISSPSSRLSETTHPAQVYYGAFAPVNSQHADKIKPSNLLVSDG